MQRNTMNCKLMQCAVAILAQAILAQGPLWVSLCEMWWGKGKGIWPGNWQCSGCGLQDIWAVRDFCHKCGAPKDGGGAVKGWRAEGGRERRKKEGVRHLIQVQVRKAWGGWRLWRGWVGREGKRGNRGKHVAVSRWEQYECMMAMVKWLQETDQQSALTMGIAFRSVQLLKQVLGLRVSVGAG